MVSARWGWVAGILLLAGCGGGATSWRSEAPAERPVVPVPDREKEFSDIPVPREFVRDTRSWSRERGTFRMCSLVYTGPLDPYSTAEFMKKQMEISGWRLLDKSLDNDQKTLNFSKGSDRCRVSVMRVPGEHKTHLAIAVEPQGTGTE